MITIQTLTKLIKTEFNKALATAPMPKYQPAMTTIPSVNASETYDWLGAVPQLREWIGEKFAKPVKDWGFTLTNKKFEGTVDVDEDALDDDQTGMIGVRIRDLASRASTFPSKLVSDLVINAGTLLAYDGSAFYADRTAPNDNNLAGAGVTEANILTDLIQARKAMMRFADDYGEPLELEGDTIITPPELEVTFKKVVNSATYITATASGVANVWAGIIKTVIVDARLTDLTDWHLLCCNRPLQPFIYQNRKAPTMVEMTASDSEARFFRGKLYYSVEMRGNAGYGMFQMAARVVNT